MKLIYFRKLCDCGNIITTLHVKLILRAPTYSILYGYSIMNCGYTFQNKKCLQNGTLTELQDEWTYQLTYDANCINMKCIGLFDFLARLVLTLEKFIEKISYRLVFYFLPVTYLHRPIVSAQGCISYRRHTCIRLSVVNLSLREVSRMRVRMRNFILKLCRNINFHEVSCEFSSPISKLENSEHSTYQFFEIL